MAPNVSIVLAERPKDQIILGKTFKEDITEAPTPADLQDGQILVETIYLSLDPAMRGWLNDSRSYLPPVKLGSTMRGGAVTRVLASRSKQASEGDFIFAYTGWTQYAILSEGAFEPASRFPGLRKPEDMLSSLGSVGMTAWYGVTQIGDPQPGETVVVSGAAGATGSIAGQLCKARGARVVGIAGTEDKCQWLVNDLGFDVALNYKDADFKTKFKEATPNFIDVFYDNGQSLICESHLGAAADSITYKVGGEMLNMALSRAKEFSRFVMCGAISQYNTSKPEGPSNIFNVVSMRIKMQGFIVTDHMDRWPEARKQMSQWIAEGKIKTNETILKGGIKAVEQGLVDLFNGINTGKLCVQVKDPNQAPSKL